MSIQEEASADYLTELRHLATRQRAATAIIDGGRHLTYQQLMSAVDQRAAALTEAGVRPGERVALVAQNSANFLVSAFAVWAAGGVLATVYPSTGLDELRYTLDNADPSLVLVDRETSSAVRTAISDDTPLAYIDAESFTPPAVRRATVANPTHLREPLFFICYSSGTTSRPKAIMLSQSAMYNGARTYADVWHLTSLDRTIACLPMAWLYGLDSTSMATLLVGGTVIVLPRARPDRLIDAIETHRATFLPAVTTVFAKLVDYLERFPEHDFSSLRMAVSGGEARNESVFERFETLVGRPVHDTFCASECFPLITYDPVVDPHPTAGSAGKLVPHSDLKVLDAEGQPAAAGEVGEAFSRGRGLMLGYWRDPEQTASVLTPDGWYRTKDLVRVDENGYVFVVGRLSDMIIRGGSNVSPAEVERAAREIDSIRDVCVVGVPDPIYGQEVVAAVVLEANANLQVAELRAILTERLASYKVPTRWVAVDRLPTNTTTGKIDRREVASIIATQGSVGP